MLENDGLTPLSELGEFGFIDLIAKTVQIHHSNTALGIGDDAALVETDGKLLVLSTDTLCEGVHFDPMYCPMRHLGYKAVMVNLSDICAMNAFPTHITVSLAVSSKYSLDALEELYAGIKLACDNYKIDLVGGDTTTALHGLTLSLTVWGFEFPELVVKRKGAKRHDLVCVSGDLGAAYAGLQLLEREKQLFLENPNVQPDLGDHDYVLEKQLKPEARVDIVYNLRKMGIMPTSMIDISDGLASELLHICKQSETGCRIDAEKLPIDPMTWRVSEELGISAITMAISGGEDYELLFTISPSDYEKIREVENVTVIGFVTDAAEGCNLIDSSGQLHPITQNGWNHFS